jgi:hypothetical protein
MASSGDNPKFKPLNNSNYLEWSGEMKAWLMKHALWRLVAGKEAKPSTSDAADKWEVKVERLPLRSI